MSDKTRTNPKPQYGAQAGKRGLLLRFTIFMAWVAVIGLLISLVASTLAHSKPIATNTNNGYYKDLSKTKSGKPSRYLLAFFVNIYNFLNIFGSARKATNNNTRTRN